MEFSQDIPGSDDPEGMFRPDCALNREIAIACAPAIAFQDCYEQLATQAYRDELSYDAAQFALDAESTPQSENIRRVLREASTRRAVLLNEVVKTTQDLIDARRGAVLEYGLEACSATIPDDTPLVYLLPAFLPEPTADSQEFRESSEENRIADPVMAAHIAYFTDDVETALTMTRRYQYRGNVRATVLEAVRNNIEASVADRLSSEGRFVADTHIRIQKAVADLAMEDLMLYSWLNTGLFAERQKRFDAALLSYIIESMENIAVRETDTMVTFLLKRSNYDRSGAIGA